MAWAALGKAAMGAVKAGAKKVATDKLLNRKKKTDARRTNVQKMMGQDSGAGEEKGGTIVKAQIAPMPLAESVSAIQKTPAASGGEGGSGEIQGTLLKIKTSVISVDTLLKGSYTLQQKQLEQQRKSEEKAEDAAAEEDLEKGKKKGGPNIGKLVPKQVKSLWAKLLDFFTGIILGWVMVRLVDFLPALQKFVPLLAGFGEFLASTAVFAVNVLSTFVDGAYKFVNFMQGMVKGAFGEEGAKKFGIFMENLKNLFQGFLIWKVIGEKIFKAVVANIQRTWKILKGAVTRAFKIAKNILKGVGGLINKLTGGAAGKLAQGLMKGAKNLGGKALSKVGGLFSKGAGAAAGKVGGLASKFLGPAAKTLGPVMKTVGPKIAKFAGRVPILGPLIVGVVSIMSGEPPGQAIFKALGAALGGALGTFIPIPVVGTLIGETIGVFVGDLVYELILGGGVEAVGKKLKDTFKTFVEPIFNFFKDGFIRLVEDFPTIPIPDIRPASIFAGIIEKVPGGEKLLNFTIPKWVPLIGGMGIGGILEGLPGLQEVLGFFAKFIPGLGNYVEGGKLTKIPNLLLLTPPGAPFLVPHIASSFLPGIFPSAGGDPPQPSAESAPSMKSAKDVKEKEKEKKKAEAEQKREEIKAKIGGVVGKVGGLFKNIGQGIKDIGGKLIEKHPAVMASKAVKGAIEDRGGLKNIAGKVISKHPAVMAARAINGEKFSEVKDKVGGFFKNIGKGIMDIGGKVISKHPAVMAAKAVKGAVTKESDKEESPSIIKDMSQSPDLRSGSKSSFSDVAAGADKAKNSAGIGQLEQFAFYENTDSDVTTIIKEVPILVGGGGGASPAENNKPVMAGGSGGGGSNPFAALYRGDG